MKHIEGREEKGGGKEEEGRGKEEEGSSKVVGG